MNILWLTSMPLPEASVLFGISESPFGGWLINQSLQLVELPNIKLAISFPIKGSSGPQLKSGRCIDYYSFDAIKENGKNISDVTKDLEKILRLTKPDLVHIFGSEYKHTFAMLIACDNLKIKSVVSIQGLVSVISKHYCAGIPATVQNMFTFRDLLKMDNISFQKKKFENRGVFEIRSIKKVQNIIGRTTFDYAFTKRINSNAMYFHCNETLRDSFYKNIWEYDACVKHRVFVSQASYPIKGLHFVLDALRIVVDKFPDTILYIAGPDITKNNSIIDKLKRTSYSKYIQEKITKLRIKENIVFTGILSEAQICQEYLKSNVFVCASTIENSPNSLCEAMILGVPCISSNVGGIGDLIEHNKEGFLYQYDASYMLAYYICEIFENIEKSKMFSSNSRKRALGTHDKVNNALVLQKIYSDISNN